MEKDAAATATPGTPAKSNQDRDRSGLLMRPDPGWSGKLVPLDQFHPRQRMDGRDRSNFNFPKPPLPPPPRRPFDWEKDRWAW